MTRYCVICGTEILNAHHLAKYCSAACKEAGRIQVVSAWRKAHIERYRKWIREGTRRWRAKTDSSVLRQQSYEWRRRNPDKWKLLKSASAARHPDTVREGHHRRKFRLRGLGPFPVEVYRSVMGSLDGKCAYCGGTATGVDHVIPIARGGTNDPGNLAPACKPCNSSKGAKLVTEWRKPQTGG